MTEETRLLAWEDCLNARDLGGYQTADGRETRWGAVVRSDDLSALTEAGRVALVEHGIRSIVDLRTPFELEESPNPFAQPGDHGVEYANLSFEDPAAYSSWPEFTELADEYEWMLHQFEPRVAEIMTTVARAPEGGVLVHCMYGQDRTGLVCAMMLDLAGVNRETIGEDYALSGEYLRPRNEAWLQIGSPDERTWRETELKKYSPRAEVMVRVLEGLHERHGGTTAYLLQAGVAQEDIARLREKLLADPEGRSPS